MAIAKMKLINIISYKDKLEDVLLKVLDLDNFHPEAASKMIEKVDTLTSMNEDSPYAETLQKYQEVASVLNIQVSKQHVSDVSLDLDKAKAFVEQAADHAKLIANIKHDLEVVVQENKDVLTTLDHIESSDFSFDDLFSCQYIRCRFGRLPIQCAKQLVQRENSRFAFISFNEDEHYSWCAYLTTIRHEAEVDNIFSSLDFERIHIPSFVHGTPDRAREMITEELANDLKHLDHVDQRMKEYVQGMQDEFVHNYVVLKHLNATYTVRQYVVGLGDQFEISGFVEEKDAPGIVEMFSAIEGVTVENLPVDVDKRLTPPTKLKNNWFVKPFEMFVEMYGLPAYGQMDPTPFVALTYTLLFGIMFGDLGQGLVLMLVGWLASKKFGLRLGDIGVRIGISSAIFGLAYGSFFGDEEIPDTVFYGNITHEWEAHRGFGCQFHNDPALGDSGAWGCLDHDLHGNQCHDPCTQSRSRRSAVLPKRAGWFRFLYSHHGRFSFTDADGDFCIQPRLYRIADCVAADSDLLKRTIDPQTGS